MRRFAIGAALALSVGIVPSVTSAAPVCPGVRDAEYPSVVVESDVLVPMSDGAVLHVNVVHPSMDGSTIAPGAFPVLLTQTAYNKNAPGLNFQTDYLVQRGYTQVIVDVRGTGASQGDWASFDAREQQDGGEVLDWLTGPNRPAWSNGNVGGHGTSYGAISQLFTAAQRPGLMKSLFPIVPMADAYRDITGSGGQLNTSFIPSWLGLVTATSLLPSTDAPKDPAGAARAMASHAANAGDFQVPTVADGVMGGDNAFDGPFYRTRSPIEVIDRVTAPTFLIGGWYDLFQRGTPLLFQRLQAAGVPTKLLMGPWTHTGQSIDSGLPTPNEPCTFEELELRWHDHWLKGLGNDLSDIKPLTYRPIGADDYSTAASWPPAAPDYRRLFLDGTSRAVIPGSLSSSPGTTPPDRLLQQMPSGMCSKSTTQWTAGNGEGAFCDTDNELNDPTGVIYDLPLLSGATIAGPIAAHLFVSTTADDAFLTARLEDVEPNGRSHQLSAGWNVLSLRAIDEAKSVKVGGQYVRPYHPFTRASLLPVEADTVYELWIEIFPVAAVIEPGHSLRLALQTSDIPHLRPPVPQETAMAGGVLSIYHDAEHPSAVVVPFQT
jgi:uncharacterized protein